MPDSVSQKVRVGLEGPSDSETTRLIDDENSKDDEIDSNMIDLTNIPERSSSPTLSTQELLTTASAIDILHSVIQQTTSTSNLSRMKKIRVRRLDDDAEEKNDDFLIRPFLQDQNNSKRMFNKFGGHSIPISRHSSNTTLKAKSRMTKSKSNSTKNNHKITTFFELN